MKGIAADTGRSQEKTRGTGFLRALDEGRQSITFSENVDWEHCHGLSEWQGSPGNGANVFLGWLQEVREKQWFTQ